jgi:predicted phage tail protein
MTVEVIREVRLYGPLGRRFGRVHRLAVATPAEAAQALCAVLPGFERAFLGAPGRPPARYHVFVGRGGQRETVGLERAVEPVGRTEPIRFVPVIEGAKRAGLLQVVLGAALMIAAPYAAGAIFAAGGSIGLAAGVSTYGVLAGKMLILGGIVSLLSPQRKGGAAPAPENMPSYGFDAGPVYTTQQGLPVPIGFGRMVIGSAVISAGLATDDLVLAAAPAPIPPATLPPYMSPDPYVSTSDGP